MELFRLDMKMLALCFGAKSTKLTFYIEVSSKEVTSFCMATP
jgi:hypothetical protein